MIREVIRSDALSWIDVQDPSVLELERLPADFALPPLLVQDCLDPEHLPKVEDTGDGVFVILRVFDASSAADATSVRELTRKIALFIKGATLITIHRAGHEFLNLIADHTAAKKPAHCLKTVISICKASVQTYGKAIDRAAEEIDVIDTELSQRHTSESAMIRLHETRRRLSILKRLLWHMAAVIQRLPLDDRGIKSAAQDLRETADRTLFLADELLDEATSLLNLELSLASQRNNETMRVLTVFSVFFMPLTFVVGVYGMNFRFMPELQHPYGYVGVWAVMVAITGAIWGWFRHKKWL